MSGSIKEMFSRRRYSMVFLAVCDGVPSCCRVQVWCWHIARMSGKKNHHQERSDNNIDCSPSNLAHIKKTVTVRFILDHPVYINPCLLTHDGKPHQGRPTYDLK